MSFDLSQLRYRLSTPYLANGLTVAAGVALIMTLAALLLPAHEAALLFVGVIPTTIGDAPAPLRRKPAELVVSAGATILSVLITSLAGLSVVTEAFAICLLGLVAGLVVVYGRRGIPLSVTILFANIIVLGSPPQTVGAALTETLFASLGAIAYVPWGIIAGWVAEPWNRRLVLADAMRSLETFIRVKADLYDPEKPLAPATNRMISVQANMAERFQSAREVLFDPGRRPDHYAEALVVLIDISETALAAHTDHRAVRAARTTDGESGLLASQIAGIIRNIADRMQEIEAHILAREGPRADFPMRDELARLIRPDALIADPSGRILRSAVETTARKLVHVIEDLDRFCSILEERADAAPAPRLDLSAFQRYPEYDLRLLLRHLTWASPIGRHAVRLSAALTSVYVASHLLALGNHANWILLSIAVVLRPAYGLSRQRINDRIIGNVVGCAMAALIIHFTPYPVQVAALFIGVGLAHAYAPIRYVVAVTSGAVMVLVQLHMLLPAGDFIFVERIEDTIIGTAVAIVFLRLLPFWEVATLPAARARLREAMARFLELGLARAADQQAYRLARREVVEALGALASLSQRIENEPRKWGYDQARTVNLLASGFLLIANILSMHLFLTRAPETVDDATLDPALAALRQRVTRAVRGETEAARPDLPLDALPGDLARRLGLIDEEATYVSSLIESGAVSNN